MPADPTPEARYASTFRAWALDDQKRHDEHFTKAIHEAEAAARSKAFEEAAQLCDEQRETEDEHSNPDAADVCVSLAQQIRARAKEAPLGS